jgi:hypothetical protein
MSETFLGNCMLCHSSPIEVRHINLYIIGSEGTYACHECEMKLVEFARSLSQENRKRKLQAAKQSAKPTGFTPEQRARVEKIVHEIVEELK